MGSRNISTLACSDSCNLVSLSLSLFLFPPAKQRPYPGQFAFQFSCSFVFSLYTVEIISITQICHDKCGIIVFMNKLFSITKLHLQFYMVSILSLVNVPRFFLSLLLQLRFDFLTWLFFLFFIFLSCRVKLSMYASVTSVIPFMDDTCKTTGCILLFAQYLYFFPTLAFVLLLLDLVQATHISCSIGFLLNLTNNRYCGKMWQGHWEVYVWPR